MKNKSDDLRTMCHWELGKAYNYTGREMGRAYGACSRSQRSSVEKCEEVPARGRDRIIYKQANMVAVHDDTSPPHSDYVNRNLTKRWIEPHSQAVTVYPLFKIHPDQDSCHPSRLCNVGTWRKFAPLNRSATTPRSGASQAEHVLLYKIHTIR